MVWMDIALLVISITIFVFTAGFSILSWREHENRAARISILLGGAAGLVFLALGFAPRVVQSISLIAVGIISLALGILFFLPVGKPERLNETPRQRVDERDIMFARARLQPGSDNYTSYYASHPENQQVDDATRALPGLLSTSASLADPLLFAATDGSFALTSALRDAVEGPVADEKITMRLEQATTYTRQLACYYGALDAGIAEMQPYHYYSHIGRGTGKYGDAIETEHKYGIAFTVEMDHAMISTAPHASGVMESAKEYVESARVAVQLAAAIRLMGYEARAHIDGNYRVIAPLVARDAGLGEIGRMGLLMTPRQGPRVRLGVVTTNLPLTSDGRKPEPSVLDFCNICKKCAYCCPSRSIPFDDRAELVGSLRWKINAETCFHYWNIIGTDCGRCMAVCPYSHPDNIAHNLVRWGIRHSGSFRRAANRMDDLLYGARPAPHDAPGWIKEIKREKEMS